MPPINQEPRRSCSCHAGIKTTSLQTADCVTTACAHARFPSLNPGHRVGRRHRRRVGHRGRRHRRREARHGRHAHVRHAHAEPDRSRKYIPCTHYHRFESHRILGQIRCHLLCRTTSTADSLLHLLISLHRTHRPFQSNPAVSAFQPPRLLPESRSETPSVAFSKSLVCC